MKNLFCVLVMLFLPLWAYAQGSGCPPVTEEIRYVYQTPIFPGMCAQFADNAYFLSFKQGQKKARRMGYPAKGLDELQYMLVCARDRQLGLEGEQLLFLQEALRAWKVYQQR